VDAPRIGIVGTFDVANYGDLLFPLLLREAFRRRGHAVEPAIFSPNAVLPGAWPYAVGTLDSLPDHLPGLAALFVGGGQILRFDRAYPIATPADVAQATDYWLVPAAMAALAGCQVFWNAIGVWTDSPRAPECEALLRATLQASRLVAVRDQVSQAALAALAPGQDISVVPDTAFSLARFWPLGAETPAFATWRLAHRPADRFAVVQADTRLLPERARLAQLLARRGVGSVVVLPVCHCHGDDAAAWPDFAGLHTVRSQWPPPLLLTEIIARAEMLCASSLHASIAALNYGVPALRLPSFNQTDRKFELLAGFEGVADLRQDEAVERMVRRERGVDPLAAACATRLEVYWNTVVRLTTDPHPGDRQQAVSTLLRWLRPLLRQPVPSPPPNA
jgi:hypothetical protein